MIPRYQASISHGYATPSSGTGFPASCILFSIVMLFLLPLTARAGAPGPGRKVSSQAETLRLGERIFRDGILPSGKPVAAVVTGDLVMDGRMFSCASCHGRSGLGSVEGGIVTPANAGSKLFQPAYALPDFTAAAPGTLVEPYRTPFRRPAYTAETLGRALRNGIDPAGRVLNPVMPRFTLSAGDMAILIDYLKLLSSEQSPGVTEKNLRFATVITSEVPARDAAAMLATLEAFVAQWNARAPVQASRVGTPDTAQEADASFRGISISRWQLDGPPASWRGQLEAHYAREPVFALLGGITTGKWQPIHEFSEVHGIPCLFPITDFPVISGSDWYTLYLSKGLYQEGEAAAGSLGEAPEPGPEDGVVQIFRDTEEGRALAAGFEATWHSLGRKPPVNLRLPVDGPIAQDVIRRLTGTQMPKILLLWLGSEAAPVLDVLSHSEVRPKEVYLSSGLLQQALWTLPEPVREFTSITYPYRMPYGEETLHDSAKAWLLGRGLPVDERRISTRMYLLMLLLNEAIPKMRGEFYRDRLLEMTELSMVPGSYDYERLSFGPGQRYASKGCYIVTLSRGPNPVLIWKSE